MLADGQLLAGRYLLDRPLAEGGMSQVWKATDQVLDRAVAVKVIRPGLLAEAGFAERFAAEARILAGLRHPGIVGVYDYGEVPDSGGRTAYLVMEFIDGEPLSERLSREHRLSEATTMQIVAQAADALQVAHQAGVVHRDIKPANLLVRPDGTVVVVDFGVAKASLSAGLTAANTVLGTARYMAPEQVTGRAVTPRTDVYALGAVAYECLTGTPPFDADSPIAIALKQVNDEPAPLPPTATPGVRAVVTRAMAKDPTHRFPDAVALAAAARTASSDGSGAHATVPLAIPSAYDTAEMEEVRPAPRPVWYAALGAVALAAVAALLFATSLSDQILPPTEPVPSVSAKAASSTPSRKPLPAASAARATASPGTSAPAGSAAATPAGSPPPDSTPSAPPPAVSPSAQPQASSEPSNPAVEATPSQR
jgi:eukaryotic-like serine/threonine-protein kinase